MKTVFTSLDVAAAVVELQQLVGMRVVQVYDVDSKTYLFKLHRGEEKCVLLMESGARFHTTSFDWPKNVSPSGFTMKLRKHVKNKRVDSIKQLGTDRIVVVKFGSGEATYNVIIELFNRGNILLGDHSMMILNVLRPHTEGDRFKFAVKETYPVDRARTAEDNLNVDKLKDILFPSDEEAKKKLFGQKLHKALLPLVDYGTHLLEHALISAGFSKNTKLGSDFTEDNLNMLAKSLSEADEIFKNVATVPNKGYIITKHEKRFEQDDLVTYLEFHPFLFKHLENGTYIETDSFNAAADEFFSQLESQKIELKALNLEKEAMNKVDKIKENQRSRMVELASKQEVDRKKAELIMCNCEAVEEALNAVRMLIVSQMSWESIGDAIKEAQNLNDPVAKIIKKLNLGVNHITLSLTDPYEEDVEAVPTLIDVNLDLSAHANAKSYYDNKKNAALKEKKTLESQGKAIKSAEKKAKQTLKEIHTMTAITKARKTCWFEKFLWFISSENYLVIGGRDVQQNELIVKRYMTQGDIYVHADLHGASSVVIKNPSGKPVPPKTLSEAGTMAVSYSAGWQVNVLCPAWWVYHHQVSKTAPAGEYLTPGSFMIRGTKNYLAPTQLALGFGFLFRLEESSVERHKGERCVKNTDETDMQIQVENEKESQELVISDGEDEPEASKTPDGMNAIPEQEEEEGSCEEEEQPYPDTELDLKPLVIKEQRESESQIARVTLDVLPDKIANSKLRNKNRKNQKDIKSEEESDEEDSKGQKPGPQPPQLKRGQKSKLKKIKGKYKDQDEEDKQLRMAILQSAGEKKEPKRAKKKGKGDSDASTKGNKNQPKKAKPVVRIQPPAALTGDAVDDDAEQDQEVQQITADLDIVNYFTGQPHSEDELLYALPVVAPYNTLLSYKFKVKMLPGTAKRSKAAQAAVLTFIRGKDVAQHEKDLMKNVDDHLLVRNFPGKVKMVTNVQKKK